jgi:hypothetical protein
MGFEPAMSRLPYSAADFDPDHDVDLSDVSLLQMCFNGPNRLLACSS